MCVLYAKERIECETLRGNQWSVCVLRDERSERNSRRIEMQAIIAIYELFIERIQCIVADFDNNHDEKLISRRLSVTYPLL